MNKLFQLITATLLFMTAAVAQAEVFRLQFNDKIYGGHGTLDLNKTLMQQHRIKANELDIESIDVIVKSREGGGQVWVGSRYGQSDRRTAGGTVANYNNPADWTFSRISFPASNQGAGLLLNLNGNLKLREVRLHARYAREQSEVISNEKGDARITLPMRHLQLSGLHKVNLKQLLRNDAGINPDDYHLKGIEVSLKSRQGGGQVWLESAHGTSEIQTAGGLPEVFDNNNSGSYDRKYFKASRRNNQASPWLVGFNGDIKVNEIIVNLAHK